MKKSKLIALLNSIEGDPDMVLWNGIVGDWMNVGSIVKGELVKQTLEHYLEMCRLQDCQERKDWDYQMPAEEIDRLKKFYKTFDYETNPYVSEEDIKLKRYKKKTIYFIDAKKRGLTDFGRGGDVSY